MNAHQQTIDNISSVLAGVDARKAKAARIAELIRSAGNYRWAGIYEVAGEEIAAIAWTGPAGLWG